MTISPRFSIGAKIAERVPTRGVIADVGCDHGKLSKYLLQIGKATRVIATDISVPSLQKARDLARKENLAIECREGDGLTVLGAKEADLAVICGMGGLEILSSLRDERRVDGIEEFILSPHTEQYALRDGLASLGLCIKDEWVLTENTKFYAVMHVCKGSNPLTEDEKTFGIAIRHPNQIVLDYLDNLIDIYQKKLTQFGDVPALRALWAQATRVKAELLLKKE